MKHNPLIKSIRGLYAEAYQLLIDKRRLSKANQTRSQLMDDVEKYVRETASFTPSNSDAPDQVSAALHQALATIEGLQQRHKDACSATSVGSLVTRYHDYVARAEKEAITGFYDIGLIVHYYDNDAKRAVGAFIDDLQAQNYDIQLINPPAQFASDGFYAVSLPSSLLMMVSNAIDKMQREKNVRVRKDALFIPPAVNGRIHDDLATMKRHYASVHQGGTTTPLRSAMQGFSLAGYACITLFGDADMQTQLNNAITQWFEHISAYTLDQTNPLNGWLPTPWKYDDAEVRLYHINTAGYPNGDKIINPIDDMTILGV